MLSWVSKLERAVLGLWYGFIVPDYDGMMNAHKCRFLWQMVHRYEGTKGIILEIGSWQGCSTTWLGVAGQKAGFEQLIAIDLFTGTPSWGLKNKNTYDIFMRRMESNRLNLFVKAIAGDSKDVIKALQLPQGISILHIDGDHEYSAVKADISNYTPLLNAGGTLIIDDFDSLHPDVVLAVQELMDSGKFKKIGEVKEIKGKGYGSIALMKVEGKPVKSLFVINDFPPILGGQSNYYFNLCRAFPKKELIVLAPQCNGFENFDQTHNLKVIRKPYLVFVPGFEKLCKIFLPMLFSLQIMRKDKIGCLHCGHVLSTGIIGLIFKKLYKIPYIVYTHSADILEFQKYWPIKKLLQSILRNAAAVSCNSRFTYDKLLGLEVKKEKIKLIYPKTNFVKFDQFLETESIVNRLNLVDKKIILSINRLIERKGNDVMIQAMPAVLKEIPSAIYIIGGSGRYETKLQRMVKDLKLEKQVIFLNHLSDEDVVRLYKVCDVFVMPSRTLKEEDTEGFGVVFLEANACGKPVIGSRCGGIPEAVADGYSGLLVNPSSVNEISQAVVGLLKDKDYAALLGAQGRKRVQEQFNSHLYIKDVKELMELVL